MKLNTTQWAGVIVGISIVLAVYGFKHLAGNTAINLEVFKDPNCGCCEAWIDHLHQHGFTSTVNHDHGPGSIKPRPSVPPQYRACHTGVSSEGYVFEGHIPAETILRFLNNPPVDAYGLAVPGMPVGSPGMEMEDRQARYRVMLLNNDGSQRVFEEIRD